MSNERRDWQADEIQELKERIAALEEALTPSTETKIAYWGDDDLISDWTAIKDIMKAIRKRAGYEVGNE